MFRENLLKILKINSLLTDIFILLKHIVKQAFLQNNLDILLSLGTPIPPISIVISFFCSLKGQTSAQKQLGTFALRRCRYQQYAISN